MIENSNTYYLNKDPLNVIVEEDDTENNDRELDNLKYENFQLRLKCYNYQTLLDKYESSTHDKDEIEKMKRELQDKVQNIYEIQEDYENLKEENIELRKMSKFTVLKENFSEISKVSVEIQCNISCPDCEDKDLAFSQEILNLLEKLKIIEEENLKLKTCLEEAKQLLIKPSTSVRSTNTEISVCLAKPNEIPDTSASDIEGVEEVTSEYLISQIMNRINLFIESHSIDDGLLSELEGGIVSSYRIGYPLDVTCRDDYRLQLYNVGCESPQLQRNSQSILQSICRIQQSTIEEDLQEIADNFDRDPIYLQANDKLSQTNPNELMIESVINKIKTQHNQIRNIKFKCNLNFDWCKNITKNDCLNRNIKNVSLLDQDYDIYCDKLANISQNIAALIPVIKSTFCQTLNALKDTKAHLFTGNKSFEQQITGRHQHNQRLFIDGCNTFLKSTGECIKVLNNEKLLMNKIDELFENMSVERDSCPGNLSVIEVLEPSQQVNLDYINRSCSPINFIKTENKSSQTLMDVSPEQIMGNCLLDNEKSINSNSSVLQEATNNVNNDTKLTHKDSIKGPWCHGDGPSPDLSVESCVLVEKSLKAAARNMQLSNQIKKFNSMSNIHQENSYNLKSSHSDQNINNSNRESIYEQRYHSMIPKKAKLPLPKQRSAHKVSDASDLSDEYDVSALPNTHIKNTKSSNKDKLDTNEVISYLKLRMIKLILIHDMRRYTQWISIKDSVLSNEFTKLSEKIMEHDCAEYKKESQLFVEARQIFDVWRREMERFNLELHKCSFIPHFLLAVSDIELIQLSFVRGESKLDFTISDGDNYYNDPSKTFSTIESSIANLSERFNILETTYLEAVYRKQKMIECTLENCKSKEKDLIPKMQEQINKMGNENQRLEYLYKNTTFEKEKIESHINQIKAKTKEYIRNLIEERDEIREELETINHEKELIESTITENLAQVKDTSAELQKLRIENSEYANKVLDLERQFQHKQDEFSKVQSDNMSHLNEINHLTSQLHEQKDKFNKSQIKLREMEKANATLKQREKQLNLDLKKREHQRTKRDEEINRLTQEKDELVHKLSEFDSQLNRSLNDYKEKVYEYEYTVSRLAKENANYKNIQEIFQNEIQKLTDELSEAKLDTMKMKEMTESLTFELSELENKIKEKEHEQAQIAAIKKKTPKNDGNSHLIDLIYQKVDQLINATIELLCYMCRGKEPNIKQEFDIRPGWNNLDLEDTKKLKSINNYVGILVKIMLRQIKNREGINYHAFVSQRNKYTQTDFEHAELYPEIVVNKSPKATEISNDKLSHLNKLKKQKKHERASAISHSYEVPMPKPRHSPNKAKRLSTNHANKFDCFSGCSLQLKQALGLDSNLNNTDDPHDEESIVEVIDNDNYLINQEQLEDNDDTECYINPGEITDNLVEKCAKAHKFVEVEVINEPKTTQNILTSILSKYSSDCCDLDVLDKEDVAMLQRCLNNKIEDFPCQKEENLSFDSDPTYQNKLDTLINTNEQLTRSLIKTTNKLLNLQKFHESLNNDYRQCQQTRNELSKELVCKYQQINTLETQLRLKMLTTRSIPTQTVEIYSETKPNPNSQIFPLRIQHQFSTCCDSFSTTTENNQYPENRQLPIPSKCKHNEEYPQSIIDNKQDRNTPINIHQDGDWDDVTRTMIRCLTTLSEVQESLQTTSLDEVVPNHVDEQEEDDDDQFGDTCSIRSNSNLRDHSHADTLNYGCRSRRPCADSKKKYQSIDHTNISIAFVKEKRLVIIKKIISRLQVLLERLKLSNSEITQSLLRSISETMMKLAAYIDKHFFVQNIPDHFYSSLFHGDNSGSLSCNYHGKKLTDDCSLDSIPQRDNSGDYQLNKFDNNFSHLSKDNDDTLKATERLQDDIIKLKQKLDRYQSRYKNLKDAILTNKYPFKHNKEIIHD